MSNPIRWQVIASCVCLGDVTIEGGFYTQEAADKWGRALVNEYRHATNFDPDDTSVTYRVEPYEEVPQPRELANHPNTLGPLTCPLGKG